MDEICPIYGIYKENEWVITKYNTIIKLTSPEYLGIVKEKWKPKMNEICWFWSEYDTHRLLAKYNLKHNNKYYTINLLDEISFDFCEPYIKDQLPSNFF